MALLGCPRATGSRLDPVRSPDLIGREREFELLVEAAIKPPALVIVEGEAGIGKTRLVRDLIDHPSLAERRILVGHCHPMRHPFPLGPVVEALQSTAGQPPGAPLSAVVGAVRPLLPELGPSLPPRPQPLDDPQAERHRVFRGLRELLGALGPTVCMLEDLHWADEGTLELLRFLASKQPETLTLVLTHRGEEPRRSSLLEALPARSLGATAKTLIALAPLSREEVRRLVSVILETDGVSEGFARSLHERTGGIPFAVEEIVGLLCDRGEAALAGEPAPGRALERLAVPPALRHAVTARFGALGGDARLVTVAAAVLGRPAGEELIAKLTGLGALRTARGLTEALSRALLEEKQGRRYGFRHALAAQAVYEQIPGPERRRLHRRAGQALESVPEPRPLAQIAHHYKQAGRSRQWLRYAETAADAASSLGDDRTAARILEDVLVATDHPHAACTRMALKLGEAAWLGRIAGAAIPILRRALDKGPLPAAVRGELRFSLARVLWSAGELSSSFDQMALAAEELRGRPARAAAVLLILAAAEPRMQANDNRQLLQLDRALELVRRQHDPAVTIEIRAARAYVLLYRGDPAGWGAIDDLPWNASSLAQRRALLWACTYLPQAAMRLGYHRRAYSLLDEGARISETDHGRFALELATRKAWLDWRSGRWQGLEAKARELMAAALELTGRPGGSELTLAWLLLVRGELPEAERSFRSVLERVRTVPAPLATALGGLATIELARGNTGHACELAARGVAAIREKRLWVLASTIAPIAVDALIAWGKAAEAWELTREYGRGLRGRDAPAARAALAVCRGSVAQAEDRGDLAVSHFARAERAWRTLPAPYEAAKARERRSGGMRRAEEDETGTDQLRKALEEFHALGAAWDAARVRGALRSRGADGPHPRRRGRQPYGNELSPREGQVVRLAASGKTNKEIARVLFISPRTVEKHVASALTKLGVVSRKDLAGQSQGTKKMGSDYP